MLKLVNSGIQPSFKNTHILNICFKFLFSVFFYIFELVYGESSSNARDASNVCLLFVLLFTIFIIVVTQKPVLQQPKYVTAKFMETLLPTPCIQFSLIYTNCGTLFDCHNPLTNTVSSVIIQDVPKL